MKPALKTKILGILIAIVILVYLSLFLLIKIGVLQDTYPIAFIALIIDIALAFLGSFYVNIKQHGTML